MGTFFCLQVKNPTKIKVFLCGFSKIHNSKIGLQLPINFLTD